MGWGGQGLSSLYLWAEPLKVSLGLLGCAAGPPTHPSVCAPVPSSSCQHCLSCIFNDTPLPLSLSGLRFPNWKTHSLQPWKRQSSRGLGGSRWSMWASSGHGILAPSVRTDGSTPCSKHSGQSSSPHGNRGCVCMCVYMHACGCLNDQVSLE